MELLTDTLLHNRYRILHQLGIGGMGSVYLAFDTSLEVQVAVKINLNPSRESTTQFIREARLLASLRHPNLPLVTDYFLIDNSQVLVMDYIPGDNLDMVLKREGPQPVEKVLNLAMQIGSALAYLHSQNPPVVHRDIKPANLKLTPQGQVILVDFGIAKASDMMQATATGAQGFTPGFAPPEQYGSARTGPYSDQYAFAATLYTLLTNQVPAESVQRILGQAILTPISLLNPQVPSYVQAAIEKAMAFKPEDRFASVEEFVQALTRPSIEATVLPDGITQRAQPITPTVQSPTRKVSEIAAPAHKRKISPWIWGLVGGIVIFVAVIAIVLTGLLLMPKDNLTSASPTAVQILAQQAATTTVTPMPPTETQKPLPSPTITPTLTSTVTETPSPLPTDTPADTATPQPRPLGEGKLVAFVSDREDNQTLQVWTMKVWLDQMGQIFASDFTQRTFGAGNKQYPSWSPDGTRLLYSAPGEDPSFGLDIYLLDITDPNAKPINLTRLEGDDTLPSWSPDGKIIAFTNIGRYVPDVKQIYFMSPDGSNRRRISTDFIEYDPFWTPKMDWLLYVIFARDHHYLFKRAQTDDYATPEPFDREGYFGRLGEVADPAISPDGNSIAYTRIVGLIKKIYVADFSAHGGKIAVITPNNTKETDPTWSSDSQYIAFTSGRDGNFEIYIMTSVGQLQTNLTNNPAIDMQPAWQW